MLPSFLVNLTAPRLYLHELKVKEVSLLVTAYANKPVFVGVDQTPLKFNAVMLKHVFSSVSRRLEGIYFANSLSCLATCMGGQWVSNNISQACVTVQAVIVCLGWHCLGDCVHPCSPSPRVVGSVKVQRIGKELAANYIADAIIRSPALLGSLQILGNPTNLLGSVARGLWDFVSMPLVVRP